jgi:hypothetical protein
VQADAGEQAICKVQLDRQFDEELSQQSLTGAERLAIARQYLAHKDALEEEYAQRQRDRDKATTEFGLEQVGNAISLVADFQKIASDKELVKLDKDKKAREAKLEADTINKELYEAAKSSIEADYDAKTRAIKKEAAEKEKKLNIAQAIIQTTLSVVKASPNVPFMIAAGLTGAASVAKIIATPILEFEQGGTVGGPKPTWREKVRHFANGGRRCGRCGPAPQWRRYPDGR